MDDNRESKEEQARVQQLVRESRAARSISPTTPDQIKRYVESRKRSEQ